MSKKIDNFEPGKKGPAFGSDAKTKKVKKERELNRNRGT